VYILQAIEDHVYRYQRKDIDNGYLFVKRYDRSFYNSITAIDSTLIKSKDYVWYKSSMKKGGIVPCSGIDIDTQ
jgi:hypothetical protein